jgi:hypothetical protein
VTFRWKDYRHGSQPRTMTVGTDEFLRRFLLHVLPRGFVRIRFFGFLAHRRRARDLPLCRRLFASRPTPVSASASGASAASWPCPRCGGTMVVIERLTVSQIHWRAIAEEILVDTS